MTRLSRLVRVLRRFLLVWAVQVRRMAEFPPAGDLIVSGLPPIGFAKFSQTV
jgi:hypothetical protein